MVQGPPAAASSNPTSSDLPLLEVDPDLPGAHDSSADSGLGNDGQSSYATSLLTEVKNYKYENGRRYHSYREGQYVVPNDEQEQDREDLLHHVRNLIFRGELFHAPLKGDVTHVFDIGSGTGIWAMDFADAYPGARVVGTDLSPIQPSWVPPNLEFFVDDAESEWSFRPGYFDFIRAYDLGGAIANWPRLLSQAKRHMKVGGWIELGDFEFQTYSDDDTLKGAKNLQSYFDLVSESSVKFNRPMDIAEQHKAQLQEAGFVDVTEKVYKFPMGPWPKDKKLKEAGRYNQAVMLLALESYGLALFSRVLGWSPAEIQLFLAGVRKELQDPQTHIYGKFHVIWGRKGSNKE